MPSLASSEANSSPNSEASRSRLARWSPASARLLAAFAEREAVDRRDRRFRHRLEQPGSLVSERAPRLRFVNAEPAHVLDVRPGREGLFAGSRQYDDARIRIVSELAQPVAQLRQRRKIERVERVLPVNSDEDDATGRLVPADAQAATLARRNSTICDVGAPVANTSASLC